VYQITLAVVDLGTEDADTELVRISEGDIEGKLIYYVVHKRLDELK
jgi:hypothetical protein